MAFAWDDYLTLAQELAQEPENEAKIRSAISRGYYCIYHQAQAYLIAHGRTPGGHMNTWDQFTSFNTDNRVLIQSWGQRARDIRNKADYDLHMKRPKDQLKTIFENVKKISEELDRHPVMGIEEAK